MTKEFSGQVALVTGVTGGIGFATAQLLIERGATVIIGGRDAARLAQLQQQLGAHAVAVFDLASEASVTEAIDTLLAQQQRLDILAHVAGIYPACMVEDLDEGYVQTMLATNLQGTICLSRIVVAAMVRQGSGTIVNVSSLASEKPVAGMSVYAASKAGMDAFSKALAHEVAPVVRVNIVAPGPTATETVNALMKDDHTGAAAEVTRDIPLGRLGEPREIAEAIAFLASSRASFITGAVLHVNGGSLMR